MAILLLAPVSNVFADEGHSHSKDLYDDIQSFKGGERNIEGHHDEHNMSREEHNSMTGAESSDQDNFNSSAEGGHSHGTQVYVETPPNYTVLSVFGAVNLSFLVLGLWNSRIRKKVNTDGID